MSFGDETKDKSERAVNLSVGAASPLWPGFLVAAAAGIAYWGWARWFRPPSALTATAPEALDASAPPAPTQGTPAASPDLVKMEPSEADPAAESSPVLDEQAEAILDENLAVQAVEPQAPPEQAPQVSTPVLEPAPKPRARKAATPKAAPAAEGAAPAEPKRKPRTAAAAATPTEATPAPAVRKPATRRRSPAKPPTAS